MKSTFAIETPLGRRFADALAGVQPERLRIGCKAYTRAFLSAQPSLATASDRRLRLGAAIEELVESGLIAVSRTLDYTERPPLPRFIVMLDRSSDLPAVDVANYPWRPELAWAARLRLRRSEFEALKAVQVFLRDRGSSAPIVPAAERSLELFGDEKRLDALRLNRRLFASGRLSIALLKARVYAPPFVFRRNGDGPIALVLENIATYHSAIAALPIGSAVGLVIFGGGTNFAASVGYLTELAVEGPAEFIRDIRYFGDLDRRGLEIPIAADAIARAGGLPSVRPAVKLWVDLIRIGRRASHHKLAAVTAARLVSWLPPDVRAHAQDVLVSGARLAQEAVGTELLTADSRWAELAGMRDGDSI